MSERFAAVVIAAGESRRMGTPKQLLPWEGRTFIEQIVSTLLESPLDEIIVVLGHRAEEIREQIPNLPSAEAAGAEPIARPQERLDRFSSRSTWVPLWPFVLATPGIGAGARSACSVCSSR